MYEIKVYNEKDNAWHCQTFETKREAQAKVEQLKADEYKVKGPKKI